MILGFIIGFKTLGLTNLKFYLKQGLNVKRAIKTSINNRCYFANINYFPNFSSLIQY